MSKYLIAVVGPTAIGKTALSIKIAQHFQTEIISADSRQFYKEMAIGTAVPDSDELAAAKHHCIQHISIEDTYSVGHFEREALHLLDILHKKNPYVTMVGGSGMYVDAVINGLDYFPEIQPGIREQLTTLYKEQGIEALQTLLKEKDPVYYNRVDIQNHQRVSRALEVSLSVDAPFSSFLDKPKPIRPFQTIKIGLSADREVIYDRINKRVDIMIANGLVEEVQGLLSRKRLNALQTVGYRELFEHFEGKISLEKAIENIKTNTRRFSKRQGTWYRKDETITWFDYQTSFEEIASFIAKKTSH
ncbi:tRNA (adenosine(37)-N6)-dimethylallyltransferase MiaA [Dokdonia sp.]|uniref:tRNA (adenosine(37)-N6)-dimethylallyltransferase MiaA n=1 Tax=Dokdonia sp. TaxID=2024995 RepID=UPI0032661CB6